jgi:hypothetical protein
MKTLVSTLGLAALLVLTGCVNGRFVPPDPIGRAIFGGPDRYNDDYYEDDYDDGYYEEDEIYVTSAPPRPRYEVRPQYAPAGYRDPVYIDGYYDYGNSGWYWNRGRYVERPRPGARYYRSQVYTRNGSRFYRRGYWR